jgi:hypothetical protein
VSKFRSDLGGCLIISDDDTQDAFNPKYSRGFETDFSAYPEGIAPFCKPFSRPLIPESEWRERIEHKERTKSRLSDYESEFNLPVLAQGSTNYCWFNGTLHGVYLSRAKAGLPHIDLSPASCAAKIKGYRNQGGWAIDAVNGMNKYGVATQELWPANAINKKYDTPEARENALLHTVPEFEQLPDESFAAVMTCILDDDPDPCTLGLLWWGHLVLAVDGVILPNGDFGVKFKNSWGSSWGDNGFGVLTRSKATPDEALCIYCPSPSVN